MPTFFSLKQQQFNSSEQYYEASFACLVLCWFPGVAVTKHHRLGGLKEQKFIVSKLWKIEV